MASTISAGTTSGTAIAIAGDTTGALALQTNNGTTAVTLDTSQNATFAGNVLGTSGTFQVGVNTTGKDVRLGVLSGGNGRLEFYSGGSEAMRIDSTSTIRMNTTSAWGAERFTLNYAQNTHWGMGINDTFGGAGAYAIAFASLGTRVGQISTTTSATTYTTSSDYRLKENIAPMTGALATVTQLKPVTYKWKLDGSNGQGFIAHELQAVVPDCVVGEKDATETYTDEDGNEQTRIKPQGIDTSFLVATLTAAIQELNAKVDAQAITIAELQARTT
jgi:hypothetical protein